MPTRTNQEEEELEIQPALKRSTASTKDDLSPEQLAEQRMRAAQEASDRFDFKTAYEICTEVSRLAKECSIEMYESSTLRSSASAIRDDHNLCPKRPL